jgi:hypothetical protein
MWQGYRFGLKSLNDEPWLPGQAFKAICTRGNPPPAEESGHESPADGCTCGVYAAKNLAHLRKIGYADHGVHGEVYLWGKVVEHRFGYRAQYAYPKCLVLPPDAIPFNMSEVESRLQPLMAYGADIFILGKAWNIPLWSKASGYDSAGLDWLAEQQKKYWLAEQWEAEQQKKPFAVRRREATADFDERKKQLFDQALIAILTVDLPPDKLTAVLAAARDITIHVFSGEMLALERPLGGIRHWAAPFVVKRQGLTADFNERQKQLFDEAVIAVLTVELPAEKIAEVLAAARDISIHLSSGEMLADSSLSSPTRLALVHGLAPALLSCDRCHGHDLTLRGRVVQCDDCGTIQATIIDREIRRDCPSVR